MRFFSVLRPTWNIRHWHLNGEKNLKVSCTGVVRVAGLGLKGKLSLRTIVSEEVWCLQLAAFSRPCMGIIIALGGPLLFTLENLPVLFFGALYTSMLMGAARLRIHVL